MGMFNRTKTTVMPPALAPKPTTTTQVTPESVKAGDLERRRLRRGRAQASTILTRQDRLGVATTRQARLGTSFGQIMKIINAILLLKQAFAEQDGEVLQININKKAHDALKRECIALSAIVECPTCHNKALNNEVLGIKIIKSEGGGVFGIEMRMES